MKTVDLKNYLAVNEYPGRGICIGRTSDGEKMRIAYFIMGRSENSRNRVFVTDEEGIRTEAFDPSKMSDPSLIIYAPVRVIGGKNIVTNGDQTDTIYDFLKEGKSFEDALRTRTFEPDEPNWTPRISALVEGTSLKMSILKSNEGDGNYPARYFYEYEELPKGQGRAIHTYRENGSPIPSFEGEPVVWQVEDISFEEFCDGVWESLNKDNRVSLFVREINLANGEVRNVIFNRNTK